MPNGGPTPSCLQCKWFVRESRNCANHHFNIGKMVPRLLCSNLDIEGRADWVKQTIDLTRLVPHFLYLWLEISYTDSASIDHHAFNLFPLSFIRHYAAWSDDEEGAMMAELFQAHRQLLSKLGYKPT